jgi:hypothetical protein
MIHFGGREEEGWNRILGREVVEWPSALVVKWTGEEKKPQAASRKSQGTNGQTCQPRKHERHERGEEQGFVILRESDELLRPTQFLESSGAAIEEVA